MFNYLRKSLSGEKEEAGEAVAAASDSACPDVKNPKRNRSGDVGSPDSQSAKQKRKRYSRSRKTASTPAKKESQEEKEDGEVSSSDEDMDQSHTSSGSTDHSRSPVQTTTKFTEPLSMSPPEGTPEWGVKLFELIQAEFRVFTSTVSHTENMATQNSTDLRRLETKLANVECQNKNLIDENVLLKEKLLDLEYRQKWNNLIFSGLQDCDGESDVQCINKLRSVLRSIPNLDVNFHIDKCYRIDGPFKSTKTRRVVCVFNWYLDVQLIIRNKKNLPRSIYVSEDLPEEWIDCHKILKPIFNAAKRKEDLKNRTFLSRDKLTIDEEVFTVSPIYNLDQANKYLDVAASCERHDRDREQILFLGSLSPYSNLHPCSFMIDNVHYNCAEQYNQSEKAALFDDNITQSKVMKETNPYKIKKLGSHVRKFSEDKWRKVNKKIVHRAVAAKFEQNRTLRDLLLQSGNKKIIESSRDPYWGSGVHLHDRNALDSRMWVNKEGGAMKDILHRVRRSLHNQS